MSIIFLPALEGQLLVFLLLQPQRPEQWSTVNPQCAIRWWIPPSGEAPLLLGGRLHRDAQGCRVSQVGAEVAGHRRQEPGRASWPLLGPPPDNCSGLTRIPPGCALALGLQICQRRAPGRPCTPISECILAGGLQGVEGTSSLAGAPSLQVWLQTLSAAPESFLTSENKHHLGKHPSRPGFVLTNSVVIRLPPRTPYPSTAASCSTDPTGVALLLCTCCPSIRVSSLPVHHKCHLPRQGHSGEIC